MKAAGMAWFIPGSGLVCRQAAEWKAKAFERPVAVVASTAAAAVAWFRPNSGIRRSSGELKLLTL